MRATVRACSPDAVFKGGLFPARPEDLAGYSFATSTVEDYPQMASDELRVHPTAKGQLRPLALSPVRGNHIAGALEEAKVRTLCAKIHFLSKEFA